ncbi:long-chain fatty acid--CoA ligase [candidate division KSB1 bacterium]|nr:long-chain fatty acid--CoA ligase [candidate division KSB1 bacterium]
MLNQLFDKAALAHSDATAVVYEDRRITFFELQLYVEWMAGYFQSIALRPGQRVGILIPSSLELVITFFGLVRAGGVAVPLEVTSGEHDLRASLALAGVSAVITTPAYKTLLDKVLAEPGPNGAPLLPLTIAIFEEDNIVTLNNPGRERRNAALDSARNGKAAAPSQLADAVVSLPASNGKAPASEAEKIFTEHPAVIHLAAARGSAPKIETRAHADLLRQAEKMIAELELTSNDCLLCAAPLCQHDNLVPCLIAAIAAGATLVIPASSDWRAIQQALAEERITVLAGSAAVLARLAEMESGISALRWCFCLGAPLSPEIGKNLNKKIGFQIWTVADRTNPAVISPRL